MTSTDYTRVDQLLCEIANSLSRIPYLPTNLQEEKEKFFKSSSYNPTFTYEKEKEDLQAVKKNLLSIKIDADSIGILFIKKRNELLKIIDMMEKVGTHKFTEASKSLYGVPDDILVKNAWRLIGLHDVPQNTYVSAPQARVRLEYAMMRYGFNGWKILEKEMASRACVNTTHKALYLKKNSFFTNKFINRLIVHEIGTHIMRYENGKQQPYNIFSMGLTNYLGTEEGLAVVNEELNHCLTRATLKTYAARVIAVHKALKCTFRETYNYLVKYLGKENAFEVTLRAKRGIGNTFFPGAFTKDHLYLKGYIEVKKYLNNGGELRKLYYGKIGVKDIPIVETVPDLVNPLFLSKMKHYTKSMQYR